MDYGTTRTLADSWRYRAERDLHARVWVPTRDEQQVAAELCRSGRIPSPTPPPFLSLRLPDRLMLLAGVGPTYRLALLALGVDPSPGAVIPAEDIGITLADLLRGLLPLAEQPEYWFREFDRLYRRPAPARDRRLLRQDPTADQHDADDLEQVIPGFATALGEAEQVLAGAVGVLFTAVATGDVDY
jgi:hypothetical protein